MGLFLTNNIYAVNKIILFIFTLNQLLYVVKQRGNVNKAWNVIIIVEGSVSLDNFAFFMVAALGTSSNQYYFN